MTNIALGDINTNKLTLLNGASANMEIQVGGTGTATTSFTLSTGATIMTLSQAGNLAPIGGLTTTTGAFSGALSSGAITSTVINTGDATLLTLHHDTGVDIAQQKSFIDFSFEDDNTNETPQVRIGAEVGQNANADTQIKEGSGAFVVYTNNATTNSGAATGLLALS